MDGKLFPMKDLQSGVTESLFHVWCRSTTVPYFDDEWGRSGERAARGEDCKIYYVPADMTYPEWEKAMIDGQTDDLDFMGKSKNFTNERFKVKAYEVDDMDGIFTQTNSTDAQKTIKFIDSMKSDGEIHDISETVAVKDLPGLFSCI